MKFSHAWLISDLSTRPFVCAACLMSLSLHSAIALAVSSGLCGYWTRPAAVAAPCVCRCVAGPVEARPGVYSASSASIDTFDCDTTPPAFFGVTASGILFGVILGLTLAIALATFWRILISSLSCALEGPHLQPRRPRALAP